MKGLEALENDGHLNDDEAGLRAEQFATDLALLQHQQQHAVRPGAVSAKFCDGCGNPIPEGRRLAVPGVELCVDCQSYAERREYYR